MAPFPTARAPLASQNSVYAPRESAVFLVHREDGRVAVVVGHKDHTEAFWLEILNRDHSRQGKKPYRHCERVLHGVIAIDKDAKLHGMLALDVPSSANPVLFQGTRGDKVTRYSAPQVKPLPRRPDGSYPASAAWLASAGPDCQEQYIICALANQSIEEIAERYAPNFKFGFRLEPLRAATALCAPSISGLGATILAWESAFRPHQKLRYERPTPGEAYTLEDPPEEIRIDLPEDSGVYLHEEIGQKLEQIGLRPVGGIERSMEFHIGMSDITERTVRDIEALVERPLTPEMKVLLCQVLTRVANQATPEVQITLQEDAEGDETDNEAHAAPAP